MATFVERELTSEVKLCDAQGNLNPDALGWSRHPLHVCNLSGHELRKKRWNFWIVLNEDFAITFTVADVDYTGLMNVGLLDFREGKMLSDNVVLAAQGSGIKLPERATEDAKAIKKNLKIAFLQQPDGIRIRMECPKAENGALEADIMLHKPPDHETLNVVIPWDMKDNFHFTSKQNTLAASGSIMHGGKEYKCDPENTFGVLDFGRGMWPEHFVWNWGSFNHRQDGDLIGINIGGKWTDGTGYTENGICLNGRLYKISEDLVWEYDTSDFMKPWRISAPETGLLDLELTPTFDRSDSERPDSGSAPLHQCFGHFNGTLKAGDRTLNIKNAYGWAEQVIGNW